MRAGESQAEEGLPDPPRAGTAPMADSGAVTESGEVGRYRVKAALEALSPEIREILEKQYGAEFQEVADIEIGEE